MDIQKNLLINILKNKNAKEEERLDAAHELENFDDEAALDALIAICSDENEDVVLISVCGESIGTIWNREKSFNVAIYQSLQKAAQREIDAIINDRKILNENMIKNLTFPDFYVEKNDFFFTP